MNAVKLTALEAIVIRQIAENNYQDGQPGTNDIWSSEIINNGPAELHDLVKPRSLPGVVSSLVKKGLARTGDDGEGCPFVGLTTAGLERWQAIKRACPDCDSRDVDNNGFKSTHPDFTLLCLACGQQWCPNAG